MQLQFLLTFLTRFQPLCFCQLVRDQKAVEKDDKNCFWSVEDGAVSLGCSVKQYSLLKIEGDESLTSIKYCDEFTLLSSLLKMV